jgi:hypothetical protein
MSCSVTNLDDCPFLVDLMTISQLLFKIEFVVQENFSFSNIFTDLIRNRSFRTATRKVSHKMLSVRLRESRGFFLFENLKARNEEDSRKKSKIKTISIIGIESFAIARHCLKVLSSIPVIEAQNNFEISN